MAVGQQAYTAKLYNGPTTETYQDARNYNVAGFDCYDGLEGSVLTAGRSITLGGPYTLPQDLPLVRIGGVWQEASITESGSYVGPLYDGSNPTFTSTLSASGIVTTVQQGSWSKGSSDNGRTISDDGDLFSIETIDLNTGNDTWNLVANEEYDVANSCPNGLIEYDNKTFNDSENWSGVIQVNLSPTIPKTSSLTVVNPAALPLGEFQDLNSTDQSLLANSPPAEALAADGASAALVVYQSNSNGPVTFTLATAGYTTPQATLSAYNSSYLTTPIAGTAEPLPVSPIAPCDGTVVTCTYFALIWAPSQMPLVYTPLSTLITASQAATDNAPASTTTRTILLEPPPLVLVHGLWSSAEQAWGPPWGPGFLNWLPGNYPQSIVVTADYEKYNSVRFGSPGTQQILAQAIADALSTAQTQGIVASKVDVVAHSLGGLVTRYFMDNGPPAQFSSTLPKIPVHRLVTIGTPHQGTNMAVQLDKYASENALSQSVIVSAICDQRGISPCSLPNFVASQGQSIGTGTQSLELGLSTDKSTYAYSAIVGLEPTTSTTPFPYGAHSLTEAELSLIIDAFIPGQTDLSINQFLANDTLVTDTSQVGSATSTQTIENVQIPDIVHTALPYSGDTGETQSMDVWNQAVYFLLGGTGSYKSSGDAITQSRAKAARRKAVLKDTSASTAPAPILDLTGYKQVAASNVSFSPAGGSDLTVGTSASISATSSTKTITEILLFQAVANPTDAPLLYSTESPFTVSFTPTRLGSASFVAFAVFSDQTFTSVPLNYALQPSSSAYTLAVQAPIASLPIGLTADVKVHAGFSNGYVDVTNAATYATGSGGSKVFSIGANGAIAATGKGIDLLNVSYGGQTTSATITVGSCTYSLSPTNQIVEQSGGTASVQVTTQEGCAWTASLVSGSWVTLSDGSGVGSGTISAQVSPNHTGSQQTAFIKVAGQDVAVIQPASACSYVLGTNQIQSTASGGSGSIAVTTSCPVIATSSQAWVTATALSSSVAYFVAPNTSGAARTATITIGNKSVDVTQAASASTPTVTVTPSSLNITTAQALTVTVDVSGGSGKATATGSVTLSGGGYTSAAKTLSGGSATINIPAGSLTVGSFTLTASYTPDSNSSSTYTAASGTSSAVTVAKAIPLAATPKVSPAAGTYASAQTVTITDTTAGSTIYYTTNGTTPATSSSKYAGPITVSATETIEAIAVATGYSQSAVATAAYTITIPPAIIAVSPVSAQPTQGITISGSEFGTHAAYTGDSNYIAIWDITQGNWQAGYGSDGIGLVVSSWTNNAITLGGFTNLGAYNATLRNGDELLIKVWNPSTGAGPAVCAVIVGSAATVCAVLDDSGVISTLAGNGTRGYSGDGGAATSAELTAEDGVAVDSAGNVYIADTYNARIRKVTPAGVITTIAGNGSVGYTGDGGAATKAELNYPTSVALDKTGNIYFTDSGNNVVRKISTAGVITTVAGNGTAGYAGDGGAATSAELNGPPGVAVDSSGNLYISDSGNQRVRLVTASTGKISTIAGNGTKGYAGDDGPATSAELNYPYGIALDSANNVYIADSTNFRVRKVTAAGTISTVAGNGSYGFSGDGGLATSAQVTYINAVAIDSTGTLYLYDSNNYRVRKVNTAGIIATVAGNGISGYQGDGGPAIFGEMTGSYGVAVDGSGNIYVADTGNNVVRKVSYPSAAPAGPAFTPAGGNYSAATSVAITDATSGTSIFYSVATQASTTGWTAYTGPVTVSGSETITAVAIGSNGQQTTRSAAYIFPTATPVISPAAGTYTTARAVTITDASAGASIYYTLNGTTLSAASSPLYTGPLMLSGSVKVTAVAIAPGSSVSAAATASYTLPSPGVSLSPASVAFGSQAAGSNTAKIVTLQNTGAGYLSLSGVAITGSNLPEFSQTNNCPSSLAPSASCTITVTFTPQAASSYAGAIAITDNAPASPQQVSLTGTGTGVRIITTVAGLTRSVYGNGGPATTAVLNYPNGATVDSAGNVYLADMNNNQIRKLNPATGFITAVAGSGQAGYSGNGQLAVNAQLASPQAVAADAAGNLYIADSGNFVVRKVAAATGIISTIAGNGKPGDSGDGGQATAASFGIISAIALDSGGNIYLADGGNGVVRKIAASTGLISTFVASSQDIVPQGLAVDSAGNLYVSDGNNSQVDKITASSGTLTVFAGNGGFGDSGDGGQATAAELESPSGLWLDAAQNLYIADQYSSTIRKVTASTGVISTVAGNGQTAFSGDGGVATAAALNNPAAVVGNSSGALYIVDTVNGRIRAVSAGGTISTVAGNGLFSPIASGVSALTQPLFLYLNSSMVEDKSGNLYFADTNNNIVRKISTAGVITTVAGNGQLGYAGDGGAATSARLSGPSGLALDTAGNVYIADTDNQLVRKVTVSTGVITTFAGSRTSSSPGDGGPATSAYLAYPSGLAVDAAGNLYIAEDYACAVRKVTPAGLINTVAGQEGNCDYSLVGTKTGDGGPATSAILSFQLNALALDAQGSLYIAGASSVRKVTAGTGIINTVAGDNGTGSTDAGDGGPALNASLNHIYGLAFDPSGNLYIADGTVRMVNRGGIIATVGPQGGSGYSGDGGPVASAQAQVTGVFADGAGDIYIADASGNRIRKISTASAAQAVAATPSFAPAAGSISTLQAVTLSDATPGAQIFYTLDGSTPSPFTSSLYTGPLNLLGTVKLSAIAIAPGYSTSVAQSGSFTVSTPQAAAPTFSLAAGTYTTAQTVTITDATSGATVYYTTNGTAPTTNSTRYTGAITVANTETIEAMAAASGYTNSAVASAAYTIAPPAATPLFTPVAGTYTSAQTVTITDATSGAIIYYTTNGVTPTATSTKYAGPITVSSTETIEAVAVATGYSQSAVATAAYTIVPKAAAPTFTPAAGTYGEAQLVTLASATPGTTIYYTLNGTTPTTSSTQYTGPVGVKSTETITAIAVMNGYTNSPAAVAAYTLVDSPQVLTGLASPIATTTATLNATASDSNVAGHAWFVWGASKTALTSTTAQVAVPASASSQSLTVPLTGLVTKTTYYFQPVIATIGGTAYGAIQSFTTN